MIHWWPGDNRCGDFSFVLGLAKDLLVRHCDILMEQLAQLNQLALPTLLEQIYIEESTNWTLTDSYYHC